MFGSRSLLLVLIKSLLNVSLSGALSGCTELRCNTPCRMENHKIYAEGKEISCQISTIHSEPVPWPKKRDKTSPAPEDLEITWYTHKEYSSRDSRVALDIKWKAKASGILKGTMEGFFIVIDRIRYKLIFHIKDSKYDDSSMTEKVENLMCLKFRYFCYGRVYQDIRLNSNVRVKINSLPMWKERNRPKQIEKSVRIPVCKEDVRLASTKFATTHCRYHWKYKKEREINKKKRQQTTSRMPHLTPDNTITSTQVTEKQVLVTFENFMTIMLGITVLILFVLLVLLCLVKWNKEHSKNEQVPVLMIALDLNDNKEKEEAQDIYKTLTHIGHHDITCNWHSTEEIRKNLHQWYAREIQKAHYILLMFGESLEPRISESGNFINNIINHAQNEVVLLVTDDKAKTEAQKKWQFHSIYNCYTELDSLSKHLRKNCYGKKKEATTPEKKRFRFKRFKTDTKKQTVRRGSENERLLTNRDSSSSRDTSISENMEKHRINGAIPKTSIVKEAK